MDIFMLFLTICLILVLCASVGNSAEADSKENAKVGDAFVVVDDRDLEYIVRYSIEKKMNLGADLGIVSYNEAPLKGIVASGITTITTDFSQMGKSMAQMILEGKKDKIDNPFNLILRKSF